MKYILFQLTIFFAFLPFVNNYFNTSVRFDSTECPQGSIFHYTDGHQSCNKTNCFFASFEAESAVIAAPEFGAEMGQYVKDNFLTDTDYKIKTVVIDPGHGGRDGGTSGQYAVEKDIALNIALRLGSSIKGNYPGIRVIYTRTDDVFVKLDERSNIANRNKADLFISIHCNYLEDGGKVHGSETYVMGLHKVQENLNVAKRENSSILYEQNYEQTYGGYDPNSPEGHIILSMYQNAYLDQSIQFADRIENNVANYARKRSRGVKQAGFVVLKQTTMPSVLVETGYLSNAADELYLSSEEGQSNMAISILKAFMEYKNAMESEATTSYEPPVVVVAEEAQPTEAPRPYQTVKTASPVLKGMNPSLVVSEANKTDVATEVVQYKVMLKSSVKKVDTSQSPWKNVNYSVQVVEENGMYKYLVIGFSSFEEAVSAKKKLRQQGFDEAFVVAYQNGKRVELNMVRK